MTMLPPPFLIPDTSVQDCPSTIPSSREPTAIAPATSDRREREWTNRLSTIAICVCLGDGLVHFLVWVLS
jgi:hypothetical protein